MNTSNIKIKGIHMLVIPTPFMVGPVNLYLVEGDALTLIDAGPRTDEASESLYQQMRALGFKLSDIDQVILTHHHVDHVGLLDRLRDSSDFQLMGHYRNQPWIIQDPDFLHHHDQFYRDLYHKLGVPHDYMDSVKNYRQRLFNYSCKTSLDQTLKEGDRVPGMEDWMVIETPGHAQSHISLYREEDGLMIGGDHIIGHISSNALIEPPERGEMERPKTLIQYRQSLKRCQTLDISTVLSGHGDEVYRVDQLIDTRLMKQNERANVIKKWISKESLTCYDICKKLFPKVYQQQFALTMSETLGHLDLLIENNEVTIKNNGGIDYYTVV